MSRVKRQMRNSRPAHEIKINGHWVDIAFARIVYRCAECHGELKRHNAGLICAANPNHRRFIHQRDVETIRARQAKELADVESAYEIKDGQIVPKE